MPIAVDITQKLAKSKNNASDKHKEYLFAWSNLMAECNFIIARFSPGLTYIAMVFGQMVERVMPQLFFKTVKQQLK